MKGTQPRLVIAGTDSSVGKTTVTLAIIGGLVKRGFRVQAYKVGPDYIDTGYHSAITARSARNLDSFWFIRDELLELFHRSSQGADFAIIEGVMGLFDGFGPDSEKASTAEVAKWLKAPVVLVLDARGMARSAAAMVHGYATFDPALKVAGVILNKVGSYAHYQLLKDAITKATGVPVLGYVRRDPDLAVPERHLGLLPVNEKGAADQLVTHLVEAVSESLEWDRIIEVAEQAAELPRFTTSIYKDERPGALRVRIGLAQDEAFHFYYHDGLEYLQYLGAELVPFSPLHDTGLPRGLGGIILGGGFPEVFREQLSGNRSMHQSIREAWESGMPIYAECGGLMYLTEKIEDNNGVAWPMVGLVPGVARMKEKLVALGYVQATVLQDNILARKGETLYGHEFHWSEWVEMDDGWQPAFRLSGRRAGTRLDGYVRGNLLASYLHIHFAANRMAAERLVERCRDYAQVRVVRFGVNS